MRQITLLFLLCCSPMTWSDVNTAISACPSHFWARVDSIQGKIYVDPGSTGAWHIAHLNSLLCAGSRVRVEINSRASLSLNNGIVLRLDEGTVLSLNGFNSNESTLLSLIHGFIHFLSRTPKKLEITTPIANAGPEGTEFALRADTENTAVWVYEGRVKLFNTLGSVRLSPGQGAQAFKGQPPQTQIDISPEDAVNWALYYPTILPYSQNPTTINDSIRSAIHRFRQGQVDDALKQLDLVNPDKRNTYFFQLRAAILLIAGQDFLANQDIQTLLATNPNDGQALALKAVLKLTQNHPDAAFSLATQAIKADPQSSSAYSALSYVEQSRFQLDKALEAAQQAVTYAPNDALVWARKAELELSKGLNADSDLSTQQALALDDNLERTQTVRGFSFLQQMETTDAQLAFEKAIQLDSSSPLARLGLGLTKIRQGHLQEGRRDLEIAVILDPNNSLLRSYLGKAYFEEHRNALATDQLNLAKLRDPKDPTPYFYDAIKKQTENRPVEALQDLQQAMNLNDNRAVYRSKQLLDSDRAARGASLARIYDNLGFEQRGIVEATTSLQVDPTNFSAHRFLSDSYVNQSGRETAQLSELLQAKLLQPININPVQAHLAVAQRGLLNASGMANSSFQDFTRNFEGNRPQLLVSGLVGNMGTYSDEVTLSGLMDKFSYSLGQYHYQTDGFSRAADPNISKESRNNADQRHDIYDAFIQGIITNRLNVQFEYINRFTKQGDFRQDLITENTSYDGRQNLRENHYRVGLNYKVSSNDLLLASFTYKNSSVYIDYKGALPEYANQDTSNLSSNTSFLEGQHLHKSPFYSLITGLKFYSKQNKVQDNNSEPSFTSNTGYTAYSYINLKLPINFIGTAGLSYEHSDTVISDQSNIYPKAGFIWDFYKNTRFRFAYFKGDKKSVGTIQSIEPTQIAGFNQLFDDFPGNFFSFYGVALDVKLHSALFTGIEFYERRIFKPQGNDLLSNNSSTFYINWTLTENFAFSGRYRYRKDITPDDPFAKLVFTHSIPLELRYFDYSGFFSRITGTYVNQSNDNQSIKNYTASSNFFLLDAAIGFRLPKRLGIFSIEGKNLLNNNYLFDDMSRRDSSNLFFNTSEYIPQREIFARIIFNF